MKLEFTQPAVAALTQIRDFIGQDNPKAAARVGQRIRAATVSLRDFPWIGRLGAQPGTREWVVPGLPYILVYEVDEDRAIVRILSVFHGAQDRAS